MRKKIKLFYEGHSLSIDVNQADGGVYIYYEHYPTWNIERKLIKALRGRAISSSGVLGEFLEVKTDFLTIKALISALRGVGLVVKGLSNKKGSAR